MPRTTPLIAVVNDEVAFVRLLDALLQGEGYTTLLLQSGEIAYESITQHLPDLIIVDISATQAEVSWKTIDLLVVDPATTTIPAILCTVADQTYRDRLPKLHALGYTVIEKPFALDELMTHIREALARSHR